MSAAVRTPVTSSRREERRPAAEAELRRIFANSDPSSSKGLEKTDLSLRSRSPSSERIPSRFTGNPSPSSAISGRRSETPQRFPRSLNDLRLSSWRAVAIPRDPPSAIGEVTRTSGASASEPGGLRDPFQAPDPRSRPFGRTRRVCPTTRSRLTTAGRNPQRTGVSRSDGPFKSSSWTFPLTRDAGPASAHFERAFPYPWATSAISGRAHGGMGVPVPPRFPRPPSSNDVAADCHRPSHGPWPAAEIAFRTARNPCKPPTIRCRPSVCCYMYAQIGCGRAANPIPSLVKGREQEQETRKP